MEVLAGGLLLIFWSSGGREQNTHLPMMASRMNLNFVSVFIVTEYFSPVNTVR